VGFSPNNAGVQGTSNNIGVFGSSTNNIGIFGTSTGNYGVFGTGNSTVGIFGNSSSSAGVFGQSSNNMGVSGFSSSGAGVFGTTTSGLAGRFDGPLVVNGSFTATGVKSAVVPHPDGSHRRLYCLESPESWFEDFGTGELVAGRGSVKLDDDFAAVVHKDAYYVFITVEGDCNGVYIANKSAQGFEVRELGGGQNSLSFCYRVVARRRDVKGPRLERVRLPAPVESLARSPAQLPKPPRTVAPPSP
jgi:hypothetical protein